MPKKHYTDFTKQAQASQTRRSQSPRVEDGAAAASSSSPASVSERLEQLRREQTPRATVEQRNAVSAVVSTPSVPPSLRHLLAIPDTEPLRPQRGQAYQRRQHGAMNRPTPGPAAPLSWLHSSRYAPRSPDSSDQRGVDVKTLTYDGWKRAKGRFNLASMDAKLPSLPRPGSLMDNAMRTLARNWQWIAEYEQYNLAAMPVTLKGHLLSYLAMYGPSEGLSLHSIKTLFLDESELPGGTGSKELEVLDLSAFIGRAESISLTDMQKYWTSAAMASEDLPYSILPTNRLSGGGPPESWETASDSDPSTGLTTLPKALNNRFPHLTALSLSIWTASPTASWSQLLNLSTHLSTLTHLSLSQWPTPSLTPNAKTAFMESKHGSVNLGASNLYSVMDDDWHEAASILRRFSNNIYRLRVLDLEGCNDWLPALVWSGQGAVSDQWATDRMGSRGFASAHARADATQARQTSSPGLGWNTSWAQLTHIKISQGWVPSDTVAVRALPSGDLQIQLLNYLRSAKRPSRSRKGGPVARLSGRDDDREVRTSYVHEVKRWLEKEKEARRIAGTIRALRSSAGGKWIEFEHGWDPNAAGRSQAEDPPDIAIAASVRAMNGGREEAAGQGDED